MDENSDIRLGGRLLATATLICAGFAAATLLPFLTPSSRQPSETPAPEAENLARQQQTRFHEFTVPAVAQNTDDSPALVDDSTLSSQINDGSPVPSAEARVPLRTAQAAIPGEHGVYVPVTVHPVTVNVDGSAFAEQMARLASGVDEMLTAQRDVLEHRYIVETSDGSRQPAWDVPAPNESRLNNIDASIRELSQSVETLRTESRNAVSRLTSDFQQARVTSEMLDEFQRTLAEHRQLLVEASQSTGDPAPRIARHPDADPVPLIDTPMINADDAEPAPWVDLPLEDDSDIIEVPLPVEPRQRVPQPPEQDEEENLSGQARYDGASPKTPIGMSRPVPVIASMKPMVQPEPPMPQIHPAGDNSAPLMPVPPQPVLPEPQQPAELATRLVPEDDDGCVPEIPFVDEPDDSLKTVATEPAVQAERKEGPEAVVFEQTYSFALPPATDPLAARETTQPATEPKMASTAARPGASKPSATTLKPAAHIQTPPVPAIPELAGDAQPTTQVAENLTLSRMPPYRRQPASSIQRTATGQLSARLADGVDAVRDMGNDLRDGAMNLLPGSGRRPAPVTAPARVRPDAISDAQPSPLHRVSSFFRHVGRGRTVE